MRLTIKERLYAKREIDPVTGCWLWTGATNGRAGYGLIYVEGKNRLVHRVSYEEHVGPIEKETLDHLCRVRRCFNPEHLEPATHRENTLRGVGLTAQHAKKTHCPQGHLYSGENLIVKKAGDRACRACVCVRNRLYREKNAERLRQAGRERWHRNREANLEKGRERGRIYREANREKVRKRSRENQRRYRAKKRAERVGE